MTLGAGFGMTHGAVTQHGNLIMNKGFTIMELLITLSIILVLVAMLLSALSKAKKAAQTAQCHNYRRQLVVYYYADGHDNETSEINPSYTTRDLMLDHKMISDKCYECHASAP